MKKLALLIACTLLNGSLYAETFSFKDPKGVNTISLMLDSDLEPFVGWATGIEGEIKFNPLVPDAIVGKLTVPTRNISFANPRMTAKAMTEEWLHADEHPEVSFSFNEIDDVDELKDGVFTAELRGTFSLHGVSKKIKVPVRISVIPDGGSKRGAGKGDLMVLRMNFDISRTDYGIKPGELNDKVADTIEVTVAISGYSS